MGKKILCLLAGLMLLLAFHAATAEEIDRWDDDEVNTLAWIKQGDIEIVAGKTRTLNISYDRSVSSKGATLEWFSADEDIMTIARKGGTITARSAGETLARCRITLKNGDTLYAEAMVSVVQPVTKLTIAQIGTVVIGAGRSIRLTTLAEPEDATNTDVIWSSANEKVATVEADGTVTGIATGRTKITATAADGYKAAASIDVQVSTLYTDTPEVIIESPGKVSVPVHFEGENFEEEFTVTQVGEAFSYTMETISDHAIFQISPLAAAEENHLIIKNKKNAQEQVDLLIRIEDSAITNSQKLPVVSAELLSGTGALMYRMELTNNSTEEIGEIGFLVDYRDQFGDTHYLFSNNDGTIQNYSYTTTFNLQPGETKPLIGRTDAFRSDDIITEVRLAVNYYRYVGTGEKVYIPDSQLYWYSSSTGAMERPDIKTIYVQPDVDTTDKADRITYSLRATMCDLYSYVVKPFSRSYRPGKYIAVMGDGGYAAAWGLKAQDVIYGADEMLWVDDPFFLNRALAKVYDGETVTLKVVRNGEEIEIPIQKDMTQEQE